MNNVILDGYANAGAVKATLDYAKGLADAGLGMYLLLNPIVEVDSTTQIGHECTLMCDSRNGSFDLQIESEVVAVEVSDVKGQFDTNPVYVIFPNQIHYQCRTKNQTYEFRRTASGEWWVRTGGKKTRKVS
jgi:hypothetical protein